MKTSSNGNIFCATGHCAGNSPVPGEFHTQRPVTRSFDVFFDMRLNKRLSKQSWGLWFETLSRPLWRHRNDTADFGGYILIVSQGRCGGNRTIHYTGAGAAVGSHKNTHPYDICHDVTYNDKRYGRQSHIYLQMLNFVTPYHRCTKRNGYTNLYICFELLNGVLLSRWYLTNILHAAQHYMCRSTYIYIIYIYIHILRMHTYTQLYI